MKCKKINKSFSDYNCKIYIENEVNINSVVRRYKEHRIQFDNVRYYKWCTGLFIYKNLELNLNSLPAVYIYII